MKHGGSRFVTRLVSRKEQKITPYEVYFRNQRVEEAQYTKFGKIVILRRFHISNYELQAVQHLVWYGIGGVL